MSESDNFDISRNSTIFNYDKNSNLLQGLNPEVEEMIENEIRYSEEKKSEVSIRQDVAAKKENSNIVENLLDNEVLNERYSNINPAIESLDIEVPYSLKKAIPKTNKKCLPRRRNCSEPDSRNIFRKERIKASEVFTRCSDV